MLFQYVLSFSTSIKTNDGRMSFQIFKRTPRKILVMCVCVCTCVYLYIYMFQKCYENIDKQLWKIRCNGVSTMRSKVRRSRKYSGLKILRLPFAVTPPCPYTCLPRIYIKKKRKKAFKRGRKLCSNRERGGMIPRNAKYKRFDEEKERIIFPTVHGNIYIYI